MAWVPTDQVRASNGEERITFLSRVRNAAMAPLYEHYLRGGGAAGGAPRWPLYGDALTWSPDYVVVISDVFLCSGDVIRLMNHRADIACGMDFWQHGGACAGRRSGRFSGLLLRGMQQGSGVWLCLTQVMLSSLVTSAGLLHT